MSSLIFAPYESSIGPAYDFASAVGRVNLLHSVRDEGNWTPTTECLCFDHTCVLLRRRDKSFYSASCSAVTVISSSARAVTAPCTEPVLSTASVTCLTVSLNSSPSRSATYRQNVSLL